jgi:hypothetical protein
VPIAVKREALVSKVCKSCMLVKYCNANCQRNHWPKHKKECKQRVAELRDEALFKDPPPKEDLSHLLPTNSNNFDMLYITSTRDYNNSSTGRPRLWLDMNWLGATVD